MPLLPAANREAVGAGGIVPKELAVGEKGNIGDLPSSVRRAGCYRNVRTGVKNQIARWKGDRERWGRVRRADSEDAQV